MIDFSRLKQLLADQSPAAPPVESAVPAWALVEKVRKWHDDAFAMIRGVLDEAGIEYAVPAVKIALRSDMPGLACGQELTVSTPRGRKLVIASVGSTVLHVEALPMIKVVLGADGPALHREGQGGDVVESEKFTAESFVSLLERWATGQL